MQHDDLGRQSAACLLAGQDCGGRKTGREVGQGYPGNQKRPDLVERGTTSTNVSFKGANINITVAEFSAGSLQVKAEEGGEERLVRAPKKPKKTNDLFNMVLPRKESF